MHENDELYGKQWTRPEHEFRDGGVSRGLFVFQKTKISSCVTKDFRL